MPPDAECPVYQVVPFNCFSRPSGELRPGSVDFNSIAGHFGHNFGGAVNTVSTPYTAVFLTAVMAYGTAKPVPSNGGMEGATGRYGCRITEAV
jgi:hypothetical protein